MSHISRRKTIKGAPVIIDLNALSAACTRLGLELVLPEGGTIITTAGEDGRHRTTIMVGGEPAAAAMPYRNWANDHGSLAGDWKARPGAGRNAVARVRLTQETSDKIGQQYVAPYEIGIVPDEHNPGCYTLEMDFFAGGYGLCSVVGEPIKPDSKSGDSDVIAPKLMQHYQMALSEAAAKENGHELHFDTLAGWAQKAVTDPEIMDKVFGGDEQLRRESAGKTEDWVSITDDLPAESVLA
jgi:hypothetical protein